MYVEVDAHARTHEILASLLWPDGTAHQRVRALIWAGLPKEACAEHRGPLWHSSKHSKPKIDLATASGIYVYMNGKKAET